MYSFSFKLELGLKIESDSEMKAELFAIKHLLVPTDYSTPSIKAIQYALRFALTYKAKVSVLYVDDSIPHAPAHCNVADLMKTHAQEKKVKLQRLVEFLNPLVNELNLQEPLEIEKIILDGEPADQIVRLASQSESDMIIIATHGVTGFRRFVLGGTTKKVVTQAGCPVLVVREHERDFI